MGKEHSQGDRPGWLAVDRFARLIIVSLQDLEALHREFRHVPGKGFGIIDVDSALLDELQTGDLFIWRSGCGCEQNRTTN